MPEEAARESCEILVNVDKTVVKITGLSVRGLNLSDLEKILNDKLQGLIRVIGVTGNSLEMDVYGVDESDILRDADGWISAISLADGIKVSDVTQLASASKIISVGIDEIPEHKTANGCRGERWADFKRSKGL